MYFIIEYFIPEKKIFLSVSVLLFFYLNSFSQKESDKSNISVSFGPSFPVGAFSNKDVYSSTSGVAKIGEGVNISYTHLLVKHYGIAVTLLGQRNPLDVKSFENAFSKQKFYSSFYSGSTDNPPPVDTSYSIYPNWHFDKKAWLSASMLVGGYCEFPLEATGKISFTGKVMAGVIYAVSPGLNGSSVTDTAFAAIYQSSNHAFGFSWQLSAGIKYNLTKRISLLSGLNYTGTNDVKFTKIKTIFTTGYSQYYVTQIYTETNGKQNMSTVQLNFGMALQL